MHLDEALAQISEIHRQVDRAATFRGYRSVTVGASGVIAIVAAAIQSLFAPVPSADPLPYLQLWIGAALLSVVINAVEMTWRCRRSDSPRTTRQTLDAVEQFLPCTIAGGLVTIVLFHAAPDALHLLPGLWALLFSLGIFASLRFLPRPVLFVALYYLASGLFFIAWAAGDRSFSPWSMGVTFGGGQFFAATVLYFTLERHHVRA